MQSPSPRSSSNVYYASLLAGPLIAGFAIYAILSYLFVPLRITVPLAITISILILGLSRYYDPNNSNNDEDRERGATITNASSTRGSDCLSNLDTELRLEQQRLREDRKEKNSNIDKRYYTISKKNNYNYALPNFANTFFVVGYSSCLLIVTAYSFVFSPSNEETFVSWEKFTIAQIIELGASIALCFFLPGYAIVEILFRDSDHQIRPILKLLLAYLLSILVTGLTGYIIASLGFGLSSTVGLFIAVYVSILFVLIIRISFSHRNQKDRPKYFFRNLSTKKPSFDPLKHTVWNLFNGDNAGLIVFASLFALVILSTYFLYSGAIIGDQWYHHGRSLTFVSGEFRDISIAGADDKTFSPFPSALLAAFFSISGIPSVNAYASISFLNIMPVLAFYYFFKNWVPVRMKKSALLACTLFMLSSGFGWVYVLDLAVSNPPETQHSALEMMYQAGIKSLDIILPTSFVAGAHPDFSTPLVILALPAGFTMLGILREQITKDKFKLKYFAILVPIIFLGIISHDEFYLFIILASIVPLFLFFYSSKAGDEKKRNYVVVYGALLSGLLLTVILAIYSFAGVGYFIYNTILGIPVIVLCLLFALAAFILYATIRVFHINSHFRIHTLLSQRWSRYLNNDQKNRTRALAVVFLIAWLYVFTFIVGGELSVEEVEIQTYDYSIPWYLYPMKLGVTGLLGLAFVLSYLFRRFEKEVFVFGIIIVVSFVAGPYYDEHRFSKYIIAGLAGFASLFVYNLVLRSPQIQRYNRFRILATSFVLGIVILCGALSIFMFWGYNASAYDSGFEKALGRRDFPSASEFSLFSLLRNEDKNPLAFNVAAPANEYAFHTGDLIGKVHAFSGIPWPKLTQSQLTLNASTLEGFYDLLHRSDTRYIVLPKDNFFNTINELGKDKEIQISDRIKQETNKEEHAERDIAIGKGQNKYRSAAITNVLDFAIENFEKAYEDDKYLVLAVPPLASPQSKADIGLIIPKGSLFPSSSISSNNSITLQYNKHLFEEDEISRLTQSGNIEIVKTGSILHGDKGEITDLTSNPLVQNRFQNANYIEATFRIIEENKTTNDAGIIWNDGSREYTASVRNDRLEMLVRPTEVSGSKDPPENRLVSVREINRENGVWYTLRIIIEGDHVIIYLNDMLAAQVPRFSDQSHFKSYQVANATENRTGLNPPGISRVGLFAFNNVAEFKPIEIGQLPLQQDKKDRTYFEHFYPLNMLSLSELNYETFMEGDFSVFSKKIIVTDMASFKHRNSSPLMNSTDAESSINSENTNQYTDPQAIDYDNGTGNKYLEFAKKGGTLVITNIVNPDNNYFPNQNIFQNTELAKLFSIRTGDEIKFDRIGKNTSGDLSNRTKKLETPPQLYLNVSGAVQDIRIIKNVSSSSSDLGAVSYYMHDDNKVAPFALEKKYGAGKIIVVNSGGYFSAIASSPRQYFQTLAVIPSLLNLNAIPKDNYYSAGEDTLTPNAIPITKVVGDLDASGHLLINSTSLSVFANLESATFDDGKFHVQHMGFRSLSDRSEDSDSSGVIDTGPISQDDNYTMSNAIVRDLRLSGEYQVIINLNGSLSLPSKLASYYDYIAAAIPTGFNMIINLQDGATAEFIAEKGQDGLPVTFTGEGKINFYSVRNLEDDKNEISVLLKRPEIKVINGTARFEKLYMHDPNTRIATDGGQLDVKGDIVAKFDHVDNHNEIDSNGGWVNTKYLSYLESIHFDKNNVYNNNNKKINMEFPADISALAKEKGILVPWQKALLSGTNIVTSPSIILVVIVLTILWRTGRLNEIRSGF